MRISSKSRYGVRALFDIAYNSPHRPAQIQDISRRQQISPRYLEQIFQSLKKKGILRSKRGPQGGYMLAKKPEAVTIRDIIIATEGDVILVDCTSGGRKKKECSFKGRCVTQTVWQETSVKLNEFYSSITLKDLCEKGQSLGVEREQDHRFIYSI